MFRTEAARHHIAAEIRAVMARQKVTAVTLGKGAQISEAALSRKLNGRVGFTVDELIRVAVMLRIPAAALLPKDEPDEAAS